MRLCCLYFVKNLKLHLYKCYETYLSLSLCVVSSIGTSLLKYKYKYLAIKST